MDTGISRAEYEEHNRRMDDEHHRMNRRIELLEEEVRQISQIASSVEKLANNMEGMLKEQQEQGERIAAMEREPVDTLNRIKGKALDTAVGLICGAFVTGAVMMIAQYIK